MCAYTGSGQPPSVASSARISASWRKALLRWSSPRMTCVTPMVVIVDGDREHVRRRPVGAQQDHVVEFGVGDRHVALDPVGDGHLARLRRAEADDERRVAPRSRIAVAPPAVVAQRCLRRALGGAHRLELLRRREALVGVAARQQLSGDRGVAGAALELHDRFAVPVERQPAHPVEDRIDCRLRRPRPVGILDPQQEAPAMVARIEQVEQRRPRPADMEEARRRRREAGDNGRVNGVLGRCAHAGFVQCSGGAGKAGGV